MRTASETLCTYSQGFYRLAAETQSNRHSYHRVWGVLCMQRTGEQLRGEKEEAKVGKLDLLDIAGVWAGRELGLGWEEERQRWRSRQE